MKLTTLLNERQRRIAKWDDKVVPIAEWLSEKEDMLSALPLLDSLDYDAACKYKNEIVASVIFVFEVLKTRFTMLSIIGLWERFTI